MIPPPSPGLVALVYELLDAHHDTVELGSDLAHDLWQADDRWQAHLDYLRALQRKGREALATATANDHRGHPSEGSRR